MLKNCWSNNNPIAFINTKLQHLGAVVFLVIMSPGLCIAQHTAYTAGTSFTTGYIGLQMINGDAAVNDTTLFTKIHVAGANAGCATIEVPYLNFKQTVFVEKDSIVSVSLPPSPAYTQETVNQLGIKITCTAPMLVMQSNLRGIGGVTNVFGAIIDLNTASTVIPNHVLAASTYRIPFSSYEGSWSTHLNPPWFGGNNGQLEYKILSAENNNQIQTLSPTGSSLGGSMPADTPYTIDMDLLDVFKFRSGGYRVAYERLFSFMKISSQNNKIFKVMRLSGNLAVFNHTQPDGRAYEDMKLHTFADTTFYSPPLAGNYGNQYSIMALKDSTVINFNGQFGLVLDSLEILDTCVVGNLKIAGSNPMLAYLAPCPDRNTNSNWSSPFSVSLSSTNELIKESLFKTFDEPDSLNHYILSVVTKTSATGDFKLDGKTVGGSAFTPFAHNADWSWANIELKTGVHKASSKSGFTAYHYTYYIHPNHPNEPTDYYFPSYGYTLGESISYPEDSLSSKAGTEINQLKPFSDFTSVPNLCLDNTMYLQPGIQENITWRYDFGDGTIVYQKIESQRAAVVSHTWSQAGIYWISITDSAGCHPGDSILINMSDAPTADFDYSTLESCNGTLVELESNSNAQSYEWHWDGGPSSENKAKFIYNGSEKDIDVKLIVSSDGCRDSITQTIDLTSQASTLGFPNVFSPNGDGTNDQYCIDNLVGFSECYSLQIFNRWGQQVFTTDNPEICWDGGELPDGVYYYVLTLGATQHNGNITLSR